MFFRLSGASLEECVFVFVNSYKRAEYQIELEHITIPTRFAKVRPIVPVPQHISKSKVSGPRPAQSPAREYSFSAARVLTCSLMSHETDVASKKNLRLDKRVELLT